jgi:response regulator RpfG family c-di-GMP phosphodiesterase
MIDDELAFIDEDLDLAGHKPVVAWKVIVADDEPNVHDVTQLALVDFRFDGRPLNFIHAHSAAAAFDAAQAHPDAAVLLLDVVMESEHAGLELVRRIREELCNSTIRIVLRTGQPGAAPEADVIARYDINDYKEKTELTAGKLSTLMYACLRGYRDIMTIERSKQGLERIIDASQRIFRLQSMEEFTAAVLDELAALLAIHGPQPADGIQALTATGTVGKLTVLAGSPHFEHLRGLPIEQALPPETAQRIDACHKAAYSSHFGDEYVGVFKARAGDDKILYLRGYQPHSELDRQQLDIFARNIGVSFENIQLKEAIEDAQREIIFRLGGVVETRSKETANHVRRVAKISRLLGKAAGMTEREALIFEYASPMHDIGKVGIPDAILNKPGKLTPEEWEVMKTHAYVGYDILKGSDHEILQTAAIIALEHHEKWDGGGYPFNKRGHEITLHGRITAIADVFDALASERSYKKSWPMDKILKLFREEQGKHFDPHLVELMFDSLDDVIAIRDVYRD